MIQAIRFFVGLLLFTLLLAACAPVESPSQSNVTVLPTSQALAGNVSITHPQDGSIIYAEALYLEGIAADLPEAGFRIQLISASDEILAETTLQPDTQNWSLELVHGYAGDPTEVSIFALPANETIETDYSLVSIVIAPLDTRPEGIFGRLDAPLSGSVVGGDVIEIIGTISGLEDTTLNVSLERPDGSLISESVATVINPYLVDEVVWTANLDTEDYTGPATVRAFYTDPETEDIVEIGNSDVVISIAAG